MSVPSPPFAVEFAVNRVWGSRNHQEDEYACISDYSAKKIAYFGIYDGHGSDAYSSHASKNLHNIIMKHPLFQKGDVGQAFIHAFAEEDQLLLKEVKAGHGGCTATVAIINDGILHLANVGDSTAVLAYQSPDGALRAKRISRDHKPTDPDERARIENNGGEVRGNRVIDGGHAINMSRALGDHEFKAPHNNAPGDHITWVPYVSPPIKLDMSVPFFVLASDGLWNEFKDQDLVDRVGDMLDEGKTLKEIVTTLTQQVEKSPHADNTTMILVQLKWNSATPRPKRTKISAGSGSTEQLETKLVK